MNEIGKCLSMRSELVPWDNTEELAYNITQEEVFEFDKIKGCSEEMKHGSEHIPTGLPLLRPQKEKRRNIQENWEEWRKGWRQQRECHTNSNNCE